ncbi:nucleotidyltransferase domain-containing protein [Hominifimenecus sp. rT4P-3]|uniref:nucleotidyltransferase domain-containing protein n=1 Tax=Hominifimenecus sp. rT4P-3 TaxID=3242979 RepID=UPI003DA69842
MKIDIEKWLRDYTDAVKREFQNRVWFIGLQGSYGRGEATENSDIDVVLILDTVSFDDLTVYSGLLDKLSNRDKVCGFVSGKREIESWDKADLFQFCHDAVPVYGSLDELLQTVGEEDIKRAIHTGACNLYHACVHNAVHEKSGEMLGEFYKAAAFLLQAIAYLQRGVFERKQENLPAILMPEERAIWEARWKLKKESQVSEVRFAELSELLIDWTAKWIVEDQREANGERKLIFEKESREGLQ